MFLRIGLLAGMVVLSTSTCAARVLAPCASPAEYTPGDRSTPGYFVALQPTLDPVIATKLLEANYHFHATSVVTSGFNADFPDRTRELLRCDPSVRYIAGHRPPPPPSQ